MSPKKPHSDTFDGTAFPGEKSHHVHGEEHPSHQADGSPMQRGDRLRVAAVGTWAILLPALLLVVTRNAPVLVDTPWLANTSVVLVAAIYIAGLYRIGRPLARPVAHAVETLESSLLQSTTWRGESMRFLATKGEHLAPLAAVNCNTIPLPDETSVRVPGAWIFVLAIPGMITLASAFGFPTAGVVLMAFGPLVAYLEARLSRRSKSFTPDELAVLVDESFEKALRQFWLEWRRTLPVLDQAGSVESRRGVEDLDP